MSLAVLGVHVSIGQLVTVGLTLVVLTAIHLFLTRTLTGSAIRGVGQSPDVALLVGIDLRRTSRHVFAFGIAVAALGGTLLALNLPFSPQEHVRWLAWTFLVVLLGGVGSIVNTLVAGLVVGLIESLSGALLPAQFTYPVLYVFCWPAHSWYDVKASSVPRPECSDSRYR